VFAATLQLLFLELRLERAPCLAPAHGNAYQVEEVGD